MRHAFHKCEMNAYTHQILLSNKISINQLMLIPKRNIFIFSYFFSTIDNNLCWEYQVLLSKIL